MRASFKTSPIFICGISSAVLIFVFLMEYGFGVKPCEWCVYQRYPYVFLFILNLIWYIRPTSIRAQNVINTSLLAINAALPLVHVLIEKGYIYVKCGVSNVGASKSIFQTLNILATHRSCVKINWMFLGWSMAQWHLLFASGILISYVWIVIYGQK